MKTMTATEAARNFSAVLDSVESGETLVVTRGGRQVAAIGPIATGTGHALKDVLRRYPRDPEWFEDVQATRELMVDQERQWHDG